MPAALTVSCALLLFVCFWLRPTLAAESAATEELAASDGAARRSLQRELYLQADSALAQGATGEYRALLAQLADYPLLPYLEYRAIDARLATLPQTDVDAFLQRYPDTYLAARLERQWVETLAAQQRWADVVRYHNPANTTVELACQALQARLATGDASAFAEVASLWNVARSQPNACDPVFSAWQQAGYLTPAIAWQRFTSTLGARQPQLARYIATQMPAREQALAATFLDIDRRPQLLRDLERFSARDDELTAIVLHGLQRLAQTDAPLALELWESYAGLKTFTTQQQLTTRRAIALRLFQQGHEVDGEALLARAPELVSDTLAEWALRSALQNQDWPRLDTWLDRLSDSARASDRWQYWRARALAQRGTQEADAAARTLYQQLAQLRSFYGFLAADLLGVDYALVDRPLVVGEAALAQLARAAAIERAHELYLVGEPVNAQFEWDFATARLSQEQLLAAGKLADNWGWHRNGIAAMIQASYWDDLQVRFPLAHADLVASAAAEHALTSPFVFAITRQESAFMQDARSSAGALGLMQLMPGTAQDIARQVGMRVSNQDLFEPAVNIALGSRHLARLLQDFDGNRILAAAAYNAGSTRVRQWLRRDDRASLPFDMWIETIPFGETRGYVQNVLAFAVIYGYRLGEPLPFVSEAETISTL
jgi:soluble lytic murein transglycosylase